MNWLAHALLSDPGDPDARLGNLLADLVKGADRAAAGPAFLRGVARHEAIDRFTDAHPVVARSRGRVPARWRRYAGILVDVYYDHVLARAWDRFAGAGTAGEPSEPLETFVRGVYADARATTVPLPPAAREALDRMAADDRLTAYRTADGVAAALGRVSDRLAARGRPAVPLADAVPDLAAAHDALAADFGEFFPALRAHLVGWGSPHRDRRNARGA